MTTDRPIPLDAQERQRQQALRRRNLRTGWALACLALCIMLSVGYFRLAG